MTGEQLAKCRLYGIQAVDLEGELTRQISNPQVLSFLSETLPRRRASNLRWNRKHLQGGPPTMPAGEKPMLPVTVFTDYI